MLADSGFLDLGDMRLEYRMTGPPPQAAPTLVLLHEGLGSADIWGSFAGAACGGDRSRSILLLARGLWPLVPFEAAAADLVHAR